MERVRAVGARKGPPFREAVAVPVGVVGEGARSNTPDHETREGGVHSLPVSKCTPPQRISVCQGMFDELEYSDFLYFGNRDSSTRTNVMRDARNQPKFSYFSQTREAG